MNAQICQKCQSSFSAYLDGAVSGQQMQQIAQHLESCVDCAGVVEVLAFRSPEVDEIPARFARGRYAVDRQRNEDEDEDGAGGEAPGDTGDHGSV